MQAPLTLSFKELFAYLVAAILSSSLITTIVNWLLLKPKTNAETVEIHARSVKVEAEARHVSTKTIIEAQERIVTQGEIISKLRESFDEACRERDNFEYELSEATFQIRQMETQHKIDQAFIKQLRAAVVLGLKLDQIPPADKINEDGSLKDDIS